MIRTDFADDLRVVPLQGLETIFEECPDTVGRLHQILLRDDVDHGQGRGTTHGKPSIRPAETAG